MKAKAFYIFLGLSFLLTTIWFRGRNILGAGETGLPFYNLVHTTNLASGAWNDSGIGIQTGPVVATLTAYYPLSLLQKLGIPNYLIQATLFFALLVFQLYFTYRLTKYLSKSIDERLAILASLFYLFNPISIVLVWHRFLLNHIFFYSFLPFAVYMWLLCLEKRDLRFVLILAFVATLFSFGLFAPAQLLLFWGFMFLLTLASILKDGHALRKLFFFSLLVFFWTISNTWWVLQFYAFLHSSSFEAAKTTTFSSAGNLLTLEEISKQLGRLSHLLNFRHGNFFVDAPDAPRFWSRLYYFPPILLLQWIFTISIFYLIYKTRKIKHTRIFAALFLLFIFLAKGIAPPLGALFRTAFVNFPILEAFRNPFEKFGQLFPILILLLVLPSISRFSNFLKKRIVLWFLFFYVVIIWGFPFWTGLIFTGGRQRTNDLNVGYQVEVPSYLEELNTYLQDNNLQGTRLISLPINGEGIFYDWPKGYIGVEPSYFIITTPNISYSTSVPYLDVVSKNLEAPFLNSDGFYKIASRLNAKYLLVKRDVDELRSGMRREEIVKNRADELSQKEGSYLKRNDDLGEVALYEFDESVVLPKIYLTSSLVEVGNNATIADILLTDSQGRDALVTGRNIIPDPLIKQILIKNEANFLIDNPPYYKEIINQLNFATAATAPSSAKHPLVLLKEKINLWMARRPEERTYLSLIHLGKRLSEVRQAISKNNNQDAQKALILYQKSISDVFNTIEAVTQARASEDEQVWHQSELSTYFRSHLAFLSSIKQEFPTLEPLVGAIADEVKQNSAQLKILPLFDPIDSNEFSLSYRQIFRFSVNKEGSYQVIIPESSLEHFSGLEEVLSWIQLDDQVLTSRISDTSKGLSLGVFEIKSGLHEIGFEVGNRKNLVDVGESVLLSSASKDTNHLVLPIKDYSPDVEYLVSFDYWIREGKGVNFNFNLDNDLVKEGKRIPFVSKFFGPDNYKFDSRNFSWVYTPRSSSSYGEISFSVTPLNECEDKGFFRANKKFCEDKELIKIFDKTTTVELRNVKVERRRIADPVLLSLTKPIPETRFDANFEKLADERYETKVSIKEPVLLVFSEAFHSGWRAYIDGKEEIPASKHVLVNGFANGWLLEEPGDYKVLVEFAPVDFMDVGIKISILSMLSYLLILLGFQIWGKRNF